MPHSTGLRGRELIKGHATLNDFLMLVDPSCEVAVSGADIAAVCDRHGGIGADGFVRVVRTTALPGAGAFAVAVPEAEWFMDYYNADGSVAEMCGNATRLFAHVLDSEGLRPIADGESVTIGTRGGRAPSPAWETCGPWTWGLRVSRAPVRCRRRAGT